jgi:hypothetical protein
MKPLFQKIILHLILACAAISSSLHATIPFTWIKGLYAVTKPEFNYLSPVNGLIWYEQSIVENMYRYGDDNDATIKLSKELFYLQNDNISFVPTIRADKPASFFTPIIIGKIMAVITSYRLQTKYDDQELIEVLKSLILNEINPAQKLKDAQADMLRITNERKPLNAASKDAQKKLNKINREIKSTQVAAQKKAAETSVSTEEIKPVLTPEQIAKLAQAENAEKDALQALAGSKDRLDKTKSNIQLLGKLPGAIDQLAILISQSMRESAPETKMYVSYATEEILLALLWAKSNPREDTNPKQDIADFFSALAAYIDAENLARWMQEVPYTQQNYDQFLGEINGISVENIGIFIINHYEKAIFCVFYLPVSKAAVFPPIFSGTMVYYTHMDGKAYGFPDCGETSLRNFFDIILYDQKRGILDIIYLIVGLVKEGANTQESILLRLSDMLIKFYQKHSILTNLTSQQLYNEWTGVVESLSGVKYRRPFYSEEPFYEIDAGLSNVLNVLNNLLFANSPAFDALSKKEKLDLLCSKLSRDNFSLRWTVKNQLANGESDQEQDLTFVNDHDFLNLIFKINNMDERSFEWKFTTNHFVISAKKPVVYTGGNNIVEGIVDQLKDATVLDSMKYNILIGCLDQFNFKDLMTAIKDNNKLSPFGFNFIFLRALNDNEERLQVIQYLLLIVDTDKRISAIITKLINSLPDDDHYRQGVAFGIIYHRVEDLFPIAIAKIIELKNEWAITHVIKQILKNKMTGQFLDWAQKNIKKLKDEDNIKELIITVLNNNMIGPLLDWTTEKAKELKNEKDISKVIIAIVDNKITGPLLDWAIEKAKELKNEQYSVIIAIVDNKMTGPLLDWAIEKAKELKNELLMSGVIVAIIKNKTEGPLLDWAQENVKKLKNEYEVRDVIKAILDNKVKGPLLDWAKEKIPTIEHQNPKQKFEQQLKEFESEGSVSTTQQ